VKLFVKVSVSEAIYFEAQTFSNVLCGFPILVLADCTAVQYDRLLAWYCRLSICDEVYCG